MPTRSLVIFLSKYATDSTSYWKTLFFLQDMQKICKNNKKNIIFLQHIKLNFPIYSKIFIFLARYAPFMNIFWLLVIFSSRCATDSTMDQKPLFFLQDMQYICKNNEKPSFFLRDINVNVLLTLKLLFFSARFTPYICKICNWLSKLLKYTLFTLDLNLAW